MFLFVVYALAVWYFAIRYRRRIGAFVAVTIGLFGLLFVMYMHTRLNDWMGGVINLQVLRGLLYPYTAVVVGIGYYVACLPRIEPDGACASCGYSLAGLPGDEVDCCPECGIELGHRVREAPTPTCEHRTLATWKAATRARQAAARARAARPQVTIAAH